MAGSALSVFNDFMTATDSAILTSPDSIVNEAVKNNYLLRRFMKGRGPEEVLQGGKTIKDQILFDEDSTFEYYQPNATFTWQNPQVLEEWEIQWRFCVDHMSWTDHEIELNAGGGLSSKARHAVYKRLRRVKEQRLWTSLINGVDDALFAVPDSAEMEAAGGTKPYSIPCFINEASSGLFNNGSAAWTTKQGIDPTVLTKWKPKTVTYDEAAPGGAAAHDNSIGILAAFDNMYLSVKFAAPPTKQEYFENDNLYRQFIACSKRGITEYSQILRLQQDRFAVSPQDPAFIKPTYAGIELEYVSDLDTAALYLDGNGDSLHDEGLGYAAASGAAQAKGPRYYWINANYLKPVFHTKRYMHRHEVMTHPNQPFTHVQPVDCWMNFVCQSMQRQGIVSPGDDFAGA